MTTTLCSAQHKFPLRPGEWAVTLPAISAQDTPTVFLYCLNDETWLKAFNQIPSCAMQNFTTTSQGASYTLDCDMKLYRMNGKVVMNYDGMEHMVANGSIDTTMNGTTTHTASQVDYRWKSATCSPNDSNLKPRTSR
jgi:hypothetical protein